MLSAEVLIVLSALAADAILEGLCELVEPQVNISSGICGGSFLQPVKILVISSKPIAKLLSVDVGFMVLNFSVTELSDQN